MLCLSLLAKNVAIGCHYQYCYIYKNFDVILQRPCFLLCVATSLQSFLHFLEYDVVFKKLCYIKVREKNLPTCGTL